MKVFKGPRFGRDAMPEREGQTVTTAPCDCLTCRDLGPWLSEPMCRITFVDDSVTIGHSPARWAVES